MPHSTAGRRFRGDWHSAPTARADLADTHQGGLARPLASLGPYRRVARGAWRARRLAPTASSLRAVLVTALQPMAGRAASAPRWIIHDGGQTVAEPYSDTPAVCRPRAWLFGQRAAVLVALRDDWQAPCLCVGVRALGSLGAAQAAAPCAAAVHRGGRSRAPGSQGLGCPATRTAAGGMGWLALTVVLARALANDCARGRRGLIGALPSHRRLRFC